jgi:hypothetical protein
MVETSLASLTILGMRVNNHFPFPLCALTRAEKSIRVGWLEGSSSTGAAGESQDSVLSYFNENRFAAIGWQHQTNGLSRFQFFNRGFSTVDDDLFQVLRTRFFLDVQIIRQSDDGR